MKHRLRAGVLLFAALAISGCATDEPVTPTTEPSTKVPATGGAQPTSPDPGTPPGEVMDDNYVDPTATIEVPEWDDESRASAIETATAIVTLFGQNDLPNAQWWAQLQPYVSADAVPWYEDVDPRNIATFTITGQGELVDETSVWLARVEIPSDLGPVQVLLSRTEAQAPWLLENIEFPQ